MAFSRSRTRSCAVRSRLPDGGQLGRSRVEQLAASSMLRTICSASSGAGSRSSRTPAGAAPSTTSAASRIARWPSSVSPMSSSSVGRQPASTRRPARARPGCRARRRSMPAPGRRAAGPPRRSGPGAGRRASRRPIGRRRQRQLTRRLERGQRGQLLDDRRELQRAQRPVVGGAHRRRGQPREMWGSSAIQKRNGREAQAPA